MCVTEATDECVNDSALTEQNGLAVLTLTGEAPVSNVKHELGFESILLLLPALVHLVQSLSVPVQPTLGDIVALGIICRSRRERVKAEGRRRRDSSTPPPTPGRFSLGCSSSLARGGSLRRFPGGFPVSLQGSTMDTNSFGLMRESLPMIHGSPLGALRLDGSSGCFGSFGGADGSRSGLVLSQPRLSSEPTLLSSLSDTFSATDAGSAQEA